MYIINKFLVLFDYFGGPLGAPWGPWGAPGEPWQSTEVAFGNILKGLVYFCLLKCDFWQFESWVNQTCTNTRNTSIPPGVWSFQVVFVNKFNLMEDILLLLFSAGNEGWI